MLSWAATNDKYHLVDYLLDVSEELHLDLLLSRDTKGWTALHHAADAGRSSVVKKLLDEGAEVDTATSTYRWNALHVAVAKVHTATVEVLLHHGANIHASNGAGHDPWDLARENGHGAVFQALCAGIKKGNLSSRLSFQAVLQRCPEMRTPGTVERPRTIPPERPVSVSYSDGTAEDTVFGDVYAEPPKGFDGTTHLAPGTT